MLLFSDIITALGNVMNVEWLQKGKIFQGDYCAAQGKPKHIIHNIDRNVCIGMIQQLLETGNAITCTVSALLGNRSA